MTLSAIQETALNINAMRYAVLREQAFQKARAEYPNCTRTWFNTEYDQYCDELIAAMPAELAPEEEVVHA